MGEEAKKKRQGFFIVPRIVRLKYRDLTYGEKWLYGCLCDLCGEGGTCFRSLRSLEDETGIALGSLGLMITHLHKVGLIEAVKKRRPGGTREIWHITIVDIWEENAKYLAQQEGEADSNQEETDVDNVQKSNSNVRNSELAHAQQCSEIEPECSKTRTERERMNKTSELNKNHRMREETPTPKPVTDASLILSGLPLLIFQWFCEVTNRANPTLNETAAKHCKTIAGKIKTQEAFNRLYERTRRDIIEDARKTKKIVNLGNMVNMLDTWENEEKIAKSDPYRTQTEPTEHKEDSFIDELAEQRAREWDELDRLEAYRDELRYVYQRARCDEAEFRAREEYVTQATNTPGTMMLTDALDMGYESILAYYSEALRREFGTY